MSPDEFQFFADFLRERSGISLDAGKEYLVEARMTTVLSDYEFASLSTLIVTLRSGSDPALEDRVVEEMTTNETSFFRDHQPFEELKELVIPTLIETRGTEKKLHIWSAACSAGQEPYSIAMLIKEHFPELADWTLSIIGTDLSEAALEKARKGSYSQLETNRGLPPELLTKYFTRSGVRWQINDEIREMVEFRKLNLLEPITGLPVADVVLVRNVLIYFEQALKQETLAKIRGVMDPSSYLFLGGAETTLQVDDQLVRVSDRPRTSCYQLRKD